MIHYSHKRSKVIIHNKLYVLAIYILQVNLIIFQYLVAFATFLLHLCFIYNVIL